MSLGWALALAAQPVSASAGTSYREVVLEEGLNGGRATVYGAPNTPVQLDFDAPIQKQDGGVAVVLPGADVRLHPFLPNSLIITPSLALLKQGETLFKVPLVDGVVRLTLAYSPGQVDGVLKLIRRPAVVRFADAGADRPLADAEDALLLAAPSVLGDWKCLQPDPSSLKVERPHPTRDDKNRVVACATRGYVFLKLRVETPGCVPGAARARQGWEIIHETLLLGPPRPCARSESCQALVMRIPPEGADPLDFELLSAGGTLCGRYLQVKLNLNPGEEP